MALFPFPTALVHEWFSPRSVGGAELVVQQLDQLLQPQLFSLVDGESSRPQQLVGRSPDRNLFYPEAALGPQPCAAVFAPSAPSD